MCNSPVLVLPIRILVSSFVLSRSSTPATCRALTPFHLSPGPLSIIVPLLNSLRQCSGLSTGIWYTGTRSKERHSIVAIYSTHAHAHIYDIPIGSVSRGIPFASIYSLGRRPNGFSLIISFSLSYLLSSHRYHCLCNISPSFRDVMTHYRLPPRPNLQ